jgi:hypothetical protein
MFCLIVMLRWTLMHYKDFVNVILKICNLVCHLFHLSFFNQTVYISLRKLVIFNNMMHICLCMRMMNSGIFR